jgi:putative glutamine amidotransferase
MIQIQEPHRVRIAVSKGSANYFNWLKQLHPDVVLSDFDNHDPDDFTGEIGTFSGLLLTGGGDIYPGLYSNWDLAGHCINIDRERDRREWIMTEAAFEKGLPILAICRGLQVLNVVRGGTLITDIPSFINHPVPHKDTEDVYHRVSVSSGSMLSRITSCKTEMVNSSHHQAVDRLATGMAVTAISSDGVIEAIEQAGNQHLFCVAVQWHPERMNISNPLSGKIGRAFIEAAMKRGTGDR